MKNAEKAEKAGKAKKNVKLRQENASIVNYYYDYSLKEIHKFRKHFRNFEIVDAQHVPVRYPNKFNGATGREGDNIVFEYLPYIVFISLE